MTKSQKDTFHIAIAHEKCMSDRSRVDANSVFLVRAKCTSPEGWERVTEGWIVVVVLGGRKSLVRVPIPYCLTIIVPDRVPQMVRLDFH